MSDRQAYIRKWGRGLFEELFRNGLSVAYPYFILSTLDHNRVTVLCSGKGDDDDNSEDNDDDNEDNDDDNDGNGKSGKDKGGSGKGRRR